LLFGHALFNAIGMAFVDPFGGKILPKNSSAGFSLESPVVSGLASPFQQKGLTAWGNRGFFVLAPYRQRRLFTARLRHALRLNGA
jgi:hypothetical protein